MASFEFRTNRDWLERIGGKTLPREEPKIYPMGNAPWQKKQTTTPSQGVTNRTLQQPELMLDMKSSQRSTLLPEENTQIREEPVSAPTRMQRNPLRDVPQSTQRPTTEDTPYSVEMIRGLNRTVKDYASGEDGGWGELARTRDYQKIPGMGERLAYDSTDPAYDPGLKYQQDQQQARTLQELKNQGDLNVQALRNEGLMAAATNTADNATDLFQIRQEADKAAQQAMNRASELGVVGPELNNLGRVQRANHLLYRLGAEPLVDAETGNIYGRTSNGRLLNEFGEDVTELMEQTEKRQEIRRKNFLESLDFEE